MKLEARCETCDRRFLLSQILPGPGGTEGRCPFCGVRFGRHYVAQLPQIVASAEGAADGFVSALQRLTEMRPGFRLDTEDVLKRLAGEFSAARGESA